MQLKNWKYFVMGDFNGHARSSTCEYDEIHGGFGWREGNKSAYNSAGCATVVDYVVEQIEVSKNVRNVKVSLGEACFLQHRLFIMDLTSEDRLLTSSV